ncbi:MAG: hypothetical protein AABY07_00260 [Nanoarchaeota archaeon]
MEVSIQEFAIISLEKDIQMIKLKAIVEQQQEVINNLQKELLELRENKKEE